MANPTVKATEMGTVAPGTRTPSQPAQSKPQGTVAPGTRTPPSKPVGEGAAGGTTIGAQGGSHSSGSFAGAAGGTTTGAQGGSHSSGSFAGGSGGTTIGAQGGSHHSGSFDDSELASPGTGGDSKPALPGTGSDGQSAKTGPGSGATGEWAPGLGWVDWSGGGGGSGAGGGTGGSGGTGDAGGSGGTGDAGGEGSGEGGEGQSQEDDLRKRWEEAGAATQAILDKINLDNPDISRVDHVDTQELRDLLQQLVDAQKQQSEGRIDRGVQQGVQELERAVEDAAEGFQTQRDQITADEMKAKDNQALYAEMRGDRGGIGQAQYDSIQNTAATNRLKVNQAQTKLSTDTARQIADLRAQGEFEKADSLLSITQSYLSELKALEQWAMQTNLSVDEFNTAIEEWEADFNMKAQQFLLNTELSTAQLTGAFADGTPTLQAQQQLQQQLAAIGQAMMQAGIDPTPEQLQAMGLTPDQYKQYKDKMGFGAGGGGGSFWGGKDYWDGALSGQALRDFQESMGLKPDGLWGPQTQAAWEALGGTQTQQTPQVPSTEDLNAQGEAIRRIWGSQD